MSDMVKRLKRNPERWAAMNMTAVMEGSPAQALFALEDAKADIATLAAELSRLSALVAWQDIETAPKGNGTILIGWGEYRERDGFSPAFMRWYDSVNGWSVNAMPFYPTHWQPLPPPPEPGDG